MKMTIPFTVIVLSLLCCLSMADATGQSKHESLAKRLVGRPRSEVSTILERENARFGFNSCWTSKGSTGLARHQLDANTYLHLSYANIADKLGNIAKHDKVTSFVID